MSKEKRGTTWQMLGMYMLLGIAIASCNTRGETPHRPLSGLIPLKVAERVRAGETLTIEAGPLATNSNTMLTLIARSSYGTRIYQARLRNGRASFALPATDTRQSGLVDLTVQGEQARGMARFTIEPGEAVGPITPLVGGKTIIADRQHWSMAVIVPFDRYGNPLKEGTPVEIEALHADNTLERRRVAIQHLLAWTSIFSHTMAGKMTIVGEVGNAHGPAAIVLEVAGWPTPFHVNAEPQTLPADGQLLTTLSTDTLHDKYGNVLPDGTLVTFVIEDAQGGKGVLPTYTIDGVARASLQVPSEPGEARVRASILGIESQTTVITFTPGPAVGKFPLTVQKVPGDRAYRITAGPLLEALGQYIPDGSVVRFHITNNSGLSYWSEGVSDSGYANIIIRQADFPAGRYRVEASAGSGRTTLSFKLA